MKLHLYHLTPLSAIGTPFQSDTLTGHLLCLYCEKYGDDALRKLIDEIKEGEIPFVLSNAFAHRMLPVPVLPAISRNLFKQISDENIFSSLKALKKFKKQFIWIGVEQWLRLRSGISQEIMFREFCGEDQKKTHSLSVLELHNIINRNTGQVLEEGGLFTTENTWYEISLKDKPILDVYALVQDSFLETLDELMDLLSNTGFGRDKSVGKGNIHVKRNISEETRQELEKLLSFPNGNCWLNLSMYSSRCGKDFNGFYKLRTKFGKVWDGYDKNNPFKHPLLEFEPGSVFFQKPKDLANTIIQDIHYSKENLIQCTTPIMLPFFLKESYEGKNTL